MNTRIRPAVPVPRGIVSAILYEIGDPGQFSEAPSAAQREGLEAAVDSMLAAGVEFTPEDVSLLAEGEVGERDARFGGVPGYAELNRILDEVFDPE